MEKTNEGYQEGYFDGLQANEKLVLELNTTISKQKEEIERLRKAGNEMSESFKSVAFNAGYNLTDFSTISNWNALNKKEVTNNGE